MAPRGLSLAQTFDEHYRVDEVTGCWLWLRGKSQKGYGKLTIANKTVLAHRFAYARVHGPVPPDVLICHRCDTPACVNPAHLWPGTKSSNRLDALDKGRVPFGEGHGMAILSEAAVLDIRARVAAGERQCDLAREYEVGLDLIWQIKERKVWRHI